MDFLYNGIVDFLVSVYSSFFSGVNELYKLALTTPQAWMDGKLWNAVTKFNEIAVMPVAWTLLSLFLLFEFVHIIERSQAKGQEQLLLICQALLKILIAKAVMENVDLIIASIFELSSFIIANGKDLLPVTDAQIGTDTSAFADAFEDSSVLSLLGYFIEGLLLSLAQKITTIIGKVIIQLRFVEIYVFTSVSSLAFSTLPSEEYSQIGKNYIKRMTASALHVVLICAVLYCYVSILSTVTFVGVVDNPTGALFEAFGYSILMVIALFQTGSWAKSLTQAN